MDFSLSLITTLVGGFADVLIDKQQLHLGLQSAFYTINTFLVKMNNYIIMKNESFGS